MQPTFFEKLFKHEAAGGVLLMIAAVLAMIVANSSLAPFYETVLGTYVSVT